MSRPIVDAHSHIGRTVTNGVGQGVEDWLSAMDSAGIAQAIISVAAGGIQAEGLADTRRANDVIAQAVREHPARFPLGLAGVEVRHGEAGLAEVRRSREELGLNGLVFHPTFEGFGVDSAVFHSLLEALGTRRSLVLVHATTDGRGSPTAIAAVARRFPNLQIGRAHV